MSPRATTPPSAASITNTLRLLCTSRPTYDSIGLPSSLSFGAHCDPVVGRGPYRGGGQPAFIDTDRGRRATQVARKISATGAEGGRFELPRAFDPGGFQDRCLQPGSATPPWGDSAYTATPYS